MGGERYVSVGDIGVRVVVAHSKTWAARSPKSKGHDRPKVAEKGDSNLGKVDNNKFRKEVVTTMLGFGM
uniref:Uncharacterized protein n=1 Tax=Cucumis melo TaxID=3656 RepID=A0A9I9DEB6_CUCME